MAANVRRSDRATPGWPTTLGERPPAASASASTPSREDADAVAHGLRVSLGVEPQHSGSAIRRSGVVQQRVGRRRLPHAVGTREPVHFAVLDDRDGVVGRPLDGSELVGPVVGSGAWWLLAVVLVALFGVSMRPARMTDSATGWLPGRADGDSPR